MMAMSESEFRDTFPVVIELPVQWGDMDALQHVNNAVYLKWFESARLRYMDQIEFMARLVSDRIGPVLATSSVRYRLPVEYPDSALVGARAKEANPRFLIHEYGVYSQQKKALVTSGEARIVMFDFNAGQKVNIPEDILANIHQLESSD